MRCCWKHPVYPPCTLPGGIHHTQRAGRDPLGPPRVKGKVSASTGLTPRWLCKKRGHHPFPLMLFFFSAVAQELRCPRQKLLLTSPCASLDHINPPCLFPSAFCDPGRWDGSRQAQAVALILCLEQSSRCPPCSVSPAPIRVMLSTPRGESPARGRPAAICRVFFHLHPCSTSRSWAGAPQDGPKHFGCCPGEGQHRGGNGR